MPIKNNQKIQDNTTLISTVYNNVEYVDEFFDSFLTQTVLPQQVVIVDGGSLDGTQEKLSKNIIKIKKKGIDAKLFIKKGNRAVGRNYAIEHVTGEVILCTDFGCELERNWVKTIVWPFTKKSTNIVSGYYKEKGTTVFQKCLASYVLVKEDNVNAKEFLPSSRSMAFRKSYILSQGGFPEEYSHNEDYVLAQKIKKTSEKIVFAKNAIVYWIPPKTLAQAFITFFRFALGDSQAGIFRGKVVIIFFRYLLGISLLFFSIVYKNMFGFSLLLIAVLLYLLWAIGKNYAYVKHPKAVFWLPVLQVTSDLAVFWGTLIGSTQRLTGTIH